MKQTSLRSIRPTNPLWASVPNPNASWKNISDRLKISVGPLLTEDSQIGPYPGEGGEGGVSGSGIGGPDAGGSGGGGAAISVPPSTPHTFILRKSRAISRVGTKPERMRSELILRTALRSSLLPPPLGTPSATTTATSTSTGTSQDTTPHRTDEETPGGTPTNLTPAGSPLVRYTPIIERGGPGRGLTLRRTDRSQSSTDMSRTARPMPQPAPPPPPPQSSEKDPLLPNG